MHCSSRQLDSGQPCLTSLFVPSCEDACRTHGEGIARVWYKPTAVCTTREKPRASEKSILKKQSLEISWRSTVENESRKNTRTSSSRNMSDRAAFSAALRSSLVAFVAGGGGAASGGGGGGGQRSRSGLST